MANIATNASVGKPKIGGAIYVAPLTATLPTDATTALGADFKCLGYVSDDGCTNTRESSTGNINAWGGDSVINFGSVTGDKFKFTLLEVLNVDVLKTVYGESNVTGDLTTGIEVKVKSSLPDPKAWVIETILTDGAIKRMVIPQAAVNEVGDVTYKDEEAIGYETTIAALPDATGVYHYEYIIRP